MAIGVVAHDGCLFAVRQEVLDCADAEAVVTANLAFGEAEAGPRSDAAQRCLPATQMLQRHHRLEDPLVGAKREQGLADHPLDELIAFGELAVGDAPQQIAMRILELCIEPRLPVDVASRRAREARHQLSGHEVVVRIGVRGEVGEVAMGKGALCRRASPAEHLPSDAPAVAVRVDRAGIALHLHDVGRDRAIEVFPAMAGEQLL